jgi:hypothetical protein
LITCLLYNIEQALNQKLTALLLTIDIKSIFNRVLPGRLIFRLCSQGWPDNLVYWVAFFITGQTVQIWLDSKIGPIIELLCSLPQDLPISLILFMLYLALLFWLGCPKARFRYTDNAAILAILLSLKTNCQSLSNSL